MDNILCGLGGEYGRAVGPSRALHGWVVYDPCRLDRQMKEVTG